MTEMGGAATFTGRTDHSRPIVENERSLASPLSFPYEEIIQRAFEAILVIDDEQRIIQFDAGCEKLFGYRAEEVMGQRLDMLIPHRYINTHHQHVAGFLTSEDLARPMQGKLRVVHGLRKDGSEIPFEATIAKSYSSSGQVSQMVVFMRDVGERQRAEKALRDREAYFRALVEESSDALILLTAEGQRIYASPSATRVLGRPAADILGEDSINYLHPDDVASMWNVLAQVVADPTLTSSVEYRIRQNDGSWRWCEAMLRNLLGDPRVGAIVVNNRDVTERKQAEGALQRSEREWADAMDSFSDVVYMLDSSRHLLRANRAFFEMVGDRPDALLGRHIAGILHPQGEAEPCPVCQAQEALRDAIITMESDHPDNPSGRPLEITVKILRDEELEASGILMSLHDLTHERQAQALLAESEAKYRTLFNTMAQGVVYQDAQGRITGANPAAERILGLSLDQMQGRTSVDPRWRSIHEDGSDFSGESHPAMIALKSSLPVHDVVMGVFHPLEDAYRWILINAIPQFREGESTPFEVHTTFNDITERKRAELALRESEERLRLALAAANQGFYDLDLRSGEAIVNAEYARMLGYEPKEFHETNAAWRERMHPDDQEQVYKTYEDYVSGRIPEYRVEFRQRTKTGEWKWILSLGKIQEWSESGQPLRMLGTHTDISLRKQTEEEIHQLAFFDPLTALPNRRLFLDRLTQTLAASQRHKRYGAIMFVDLDQFKHINDVYGHSIGDRVLQNVAQRLNTFLRQDDTVARFGGDEFVILLPDLSTDQETAATLALSVGEKLRAALERPTRIDGQEYLSTASIGISLFPKHGENSEDLIREADIAMFRAKEGGRNDLIFFEHGMQDHIAERYALEQDLRRAVERGELELFLQSQFSVSGEVIGAEALVRWHHPTRGLIPPAAFIPLAEESGLIVGIGEWVLREASRLLAKLNAAGHNLRLAVNVSPRQFSQVDFVFGVRQILAEAGADPIYLTLEITEGLLIKQADEVVSQMQALAALGVRFSIDDFGTGYSSLAYLKRLPLNELKIDKSFIQDVPQDSNDVALVETILSVAHHLHFEVVAEGVETQTQLEFLTAKGCKHFQGYFLHRPQPSREWLDNYLNNTSR